MSENSDLQSMAIEIIHQQRTELQGIIEDYSNDRNYELAEERLGHWKDVTHQLVEECVSPKEAQKLGRKRITKFLTTDPYRFPISLANMFGTYLDSLEDAIKKHPEIIVVKASAHVPNQEVSKPLVRLNNRRVFIIHGHDELNLLRLERILQSRWGLNPVIMSEQPGQGRTLIEKFEEVAVDSSYAIALMTPDDQISLKDGAYAQARPNVIFELGWFYGKLGRRRVCILFKKGTKIHSDLDGISTIRFNESVEEKLVELENEFVAAELIGA